MHGHLNKDWWRWKFIKSLNNFMDAPDDKATSKLMVDLVEEFRRHYGNAGSSSEIPYIEQPDYQRNAESAPQVCWLQNFNKAG